MNIIQSPINGMLSGHHTSSSHNKPLDLSLLTVSEFDRISNSPLDLSLKTRKRCADTTKTDDDVIFVAQSSLPKRNRPESENATGANLCHHAEQSRTWYPSKSDIHFNNGSFSLPCSDGYKNEAVSWNYSERSNYHIKHRAGLGVSQNGSRDSPASFYDQPGNGFIPDSNLRTNYQHVSPAFKCVHPKSSDVSAHKTIKDSRQSGSFTGPSVNHIPSQYQQYHQAHYEPPNHSRNISMGYYNKGNSIPCTKGHSPLVTSQILANPLREHPRSVIPSQFLTNSAKISSSRLEGSELRAALSSSTRYYPNYSPNPSSLWHPASQRCSPDSTLRPPNSTVCTSGRPTQCTNSKALQVHRESRNLSQAKPIPKHGRKTEDVAHFVPQPYKYSYSSVHKAELVPQKIENQYSTSMPEVQQCPVRVDPSLNVSNSSSVFCEQGSMYDSNIKTSCAKSVSHEPLQILIPSDKKSTHTSSTDRRDGAVAISIHPKLRCKKHIILSAFNNDEELKSLCNGNTLKAPAPDRPRSISPGDPPSSPKMPILSPQHQAPPVLPLPFVNEPPPLRPTTDVTVEEDDDLPCPLISGEISYSGGCEDPFLDHVSMRNVLDNSFSAVTAGIIEKEIRNIPHLSAFIETGVSPPSVPKPTLVSESGANTHSKSSIAPQPTYVSWNINRSAARTSDRKVIPVANVAPMLKRANSSEKAENKSKSIKTCESEYSDSSAKNGDLQAEIAAYKTSLRMPAKLILKSQVSEETRTGIAEEFGASKSRFRHLESSDDNTNLPSTCGKLFGAKTITKLWNEHVTSCEDNETDQTESQRSICDTVCTSPLVSTDAPSGSRNNSSVVKTSHAGRKKWKMSPRRRAIARLVGKLKINSNWRYVRGQKCQPNLQGETRRQRLKRRSMLDEIANSDGFVADRSPERSSRCKVDLFGDPALLSREERALQRAMMRFTEMENGKLRKSRGQKGQSNTQRKANQLKRKAIRNSPGKKGNHRSPTNVQHNTIGFVDFQPEVLESRTRTQSKGVHSVGGYNRDAAYENELVQDIRRRELKRARRRAHQMGSQRANARKIKREQNNRLELPGKAFCKKVCANGASQGRLFDKTGLLSSSTPNISDKSFGFDDIDKRVDLSPDAYKQVDSLCPSRPRVGRPRKKKSALMKVSWRPSTASNKGKPRVAHARVARNHGRHQKPVKRTKSKRRKKFNQEKLRKSPRRVTQEETLKGYSCKHSNLRKNVSAPPVHQSKNYNGKVIRSGKGGHALKSSISDTCRSLNFRKQFEEAQTKVPRYPLRDQAPQQECLEYDGYTTEEYEIEPSPIKSSSKLDQTGKSSCHDPDRLFRPDTSDPFPESPDQRKLAMHINIGGISLHGAARLGYQEILLSHLRSETVELNCLNRVGHTALHEACSGNFTAIVCNLLSHGADPNLPSKGDIRPLQVASDNKNIEIVRLLLSYGAELPDLDSLKLSREVENFIRSYLCDINGYSTPEEECPWQFFGSAIFEREFQIGQSLLTDIPTDDEDDDDDLEAMFDFSDAPQLLSYRLVLPETDREDNYVMLPDVLERFDMDRGTFFRELGSRVKIFSVPLQKLQDEIKHASTVCPCLPESLKQCQTIEVIRLEDLKTVEANHSAASSHGSCELNLNKTGSSEHKRLSDLDGVFTFGTTPRTPLINISHLPKSDLFLTDPGHNTGNSSHEKKLKSSAGRRFKEQSLEKSSLNKNDSLSPVSKNVGLVDKQGSKNVIHRKMSKSAKSLKKMNIMSETQEKISEICSQSMVQDIQNNNTSCTEVGVADLIDRSSSLINPLNQ